MAKVATAVDEEVIQDTSAGSAPVDQELVDGSNEQVAEDDDIMEASLEDLQADEVEEETDDESPSDVTPEEPAEETKAEVQPQGEEKPLAPKSENRFQKLANENRELKDQLERLKLQESQLATEQELLNEVNPETGDYYTPQEVERIAFAQSRQVQAQTVAQERYQLEVQQNQQIIASEAAKALEHFPMFDLNSPEYKPDLAAQYDQLLGQSLVVENGVVLGANLSPYQLAKTIADATKANAAVMQAEAQKATEKMLANADVPGGASQATKTKEDPDLMGFDEGARS